MGLGFPWITLARVLAATVTTTALGLWLERFSMHVLVDLMLATLFYGAALLLLREWRPTRQQWRTLAKRIGTLPRRI
jgi:hypothetical protein